ncbi:MAG: prepilin peptidase [Terracidiphilus sp.]|jgi:prepilin peptidase CpaA
MHSIAWWPTLLVLFVATFTDIRSRRIPNWLVLPFLLAGILISPWRPDWRGNIQGFGWHGLGQSFAGMGLGLLIFGFLFWLGGMGGGDLKLCAALGAWIGPMQLFYAMVYTGLAGGIMVLCWAVFGGFFKELFTGAGDLVFGLKQRGMKRDPELTLANPLKRRMPYAPAIAIGTLLSFFAL